MVWLMARSIFALFLLSLLLVALARLAGAALPHAPVAVSVMVERGERGSMTVTVLDLLYGGVYRRTLADGRGMFWSENACFVLVPVVEDAGQRSAMLDVVGGETRLFPIIGYRLTSWSPDGSRMTLGYADGDDPALAILDAKTGSYVSLILPETGEPAQIEWSPDSAYASMVTGNATSGYHSYLVNTRTAEFTPLADSTPEADANRTLVLELPGWRWSPDSRYIAARQNSSLLVVDVTAGTTIRLEAVQPFRLLADFTWLPDSNQLAFFGIPAANDDRTPVNIVAGSATIDTSEDTRELQGFIWSLDDMTLRATGIKTTALPLLWSPDGRLLLEHTDFETRVLQVETGAEIMNILPHRDMMAVRHLWSPDARYLALSSAHIDGKLRIVDLHTQHILEQPASDGTLEWSPDGSRFSLYNINTHRLEITQLRETAASTGSLPMSGVTRICYPEDT